jgi:Cu-Zn family superoxide dismutase
MKISSILISIILIFGLMSCGQQQESEQAAKKTDIEEAVAVLHPTKGNNVTGVVYFEKMANGIKITANVEGLSIGKHGFHIHTYGDCRADDATSAGGHFNPHDKKHGAPTDKERHVGDLGNIIAPKEGTATYERLDEVISFSGPNNIIGRAVIIHSGEDDLTSQPTGAAGSRVACGVIGIANPEQ